MRNGLNSDEQTQFLNYAGGNPGATNFLLQIISPMVTQELLRKNKKNTLTIKKFLPVT